MERHAAFFVLECSPFPVALLLLRPLSPSPVPVCAISAALCHQRRILPSASLSAISPLVPAVAGWLFFLVLIIFFVFERSTYVLTDVWLSAWSNAGSGEDASGVAVFFGLGDIDSAADNRAYLYVYIGLFTANALFVVMRTFWFSYGGVRAAMNLFRAMLLATMRSPMSFFDVTPVGRVTNRLTYDTDILDIIFVQKSVQAVASVLWVASALIVLLFTVPVLIAAIAPLSVAYYVIHTAYVRSGVQLQRLHAQSQSPLVSHVEESVGGAVTIRAFGAVRRFSEAFATLNDTTIATFLAFVATGRWLAVRLETIGAFLSFATTLACWLLRDDLSGSFTGLAIVWSFNMTLSLSFLVLSSTEFESKGVSLERVVEYGSLPAEAPRHVAAADTPPAAWPTAGGLEFQGVTL
eukprot:4586689-Pleurochrysis_carterae.AAC.1